MAKERASSYRNVAAKGEAPKWEIWYQKTVADAVMMTDAGDEAKTVADAIAENQSEMKTVKTKLAGIAEGANKYVHPSYTPKAAGLYKVTVDNTGHISATAAVEKADITSLGIPGQDTTYSPMAGASASAAGSAGLVPAPAAGKQGQFLRGDGTWAAPASYTHPNSGVTAGTYKSVTVDGQGHVTAGSNPTTLAGYGITDAAAKSHTHGNADITAVDASKITGVIGIDHLPAGALERCIVVADDTARKALTTAQVQIGDTVKVISTKMMYFVVDDAKLSTDDGYEVYTAGSATSVPWSGVTGKPSTYAPSAHSHDDKYYTEAEMDTKLNTKVDKVSGKQLSTEDYTSAEKTKLAGIAANANNYVHPAAHPASMITEDTTHRFVSDAEKVSWNEKPDIYFGSDLPTSAPAGSLCYIIG